MIGVTVGAACCFWYVLSILLAISVYTTSQLYPINYTSIPLSLSVEEVLPKTRVDVRRLFKAKALCGIKMPILC